jgi:hypothetical protein
MFGTDGSPLPARCRKGRGGEEGGVQQWVLSSDLAGRSLQGWRDRSGKRWRRETAQHRVCERSRSLLASMTQRMTMRLRPTVGRTSVDHLASDSREASEPVRLVLLCRLEPDVLRQPPLVVDPLRADEQEGRQPLGERGLVGGARADDVERVGKEKVGLVRGQLQDARQKTGSATREGQEENG